MIKISNFFLKILGISDAVHSSLLLRSWQLFGGALNLLFVSIFLSSIEQGYFYTFNSLIGIQVIFEMGLAFVILQFSGHFFSKLKWGANGMVEGDCYVSSQFHTFLYSACYWYFVAALLMFLVLIPLGNYFFSHSSHLDFLHNGWQFPWFFLVFFTTINLINLPLLSAIEGGGKVALISRLRLKQALLGNVLSWVALYFGVALWFTFIPILISSIYTQYWLWKNFPLLLKKLIALKADKTEATFSWAEEVWPMQWRIAISWISGYFIFQLYTPVIFHYQGAVEAGKMGMSIAVCSILTNVGFVWLQANTPQLTKFASKAKWMAFDRAFFKYFYQSLSIVFIGVISIMLGLFVIQDTKYASRLISPDLMFLLLVAFAISHIISALAYYLRLHKKEPFVILSVFGAIIMAPGIFYFGRKYGIAGMVYTVLILNITYGLPTAYLLWSRLRKAWHSPAH